MSSTHNFRSVDPNRATGFLLVRSISAVSGDLLAIWLHGSSGDAEHANEDDYTDDFVRTIAQDMQVLSLDAGGQSTWGNDASTNEVQLEHDAAITNFGAAAAVPVIGYSMGAATACNFARRFPTRVSRLLLIAPALDIQYHYDNGYAADIDAAYGGSWSTNGAATHDPVDFAGSLSAIPVDIRYGDADTVIPAAPISTFASAHGNTNVVSYAGATHTDIFTALDADPDPIVTFLTS